MRTLLLTFVGWVAAVTPTLAQQATGPAKLPGWLVGCWERRGNQVTEERWLPATGGALFGVSTTVRNDRVSGWEYLRIERSREGLIYHAIPSGQQPTAFPAKVASDTLLVFENLEHDFPQRIIYRKAGADSLLARIEATVKDSLRGIDFKFRRVTCRVE
ncbi:MAG: DUF6265 family protein [Gemmatimonadales bacterium]